MGVTDIMLGQVIGRDCKGQKQGILDAVQVPMDPATQCDGGLVLWFLLPNAPSRQEPRILLFSGPAYRCSGTYYNGLEDRCRGSFYPMLQADRSRGSYYLVGRHVGAMNPTRKWALRIDVVDSTTRWASVNRFCGSYYPVGRWIDAVDPTTRWDRGQTLRILLPNVMASMCECDVLEMGNIETMTCCIEGRNVGCFITGPFDI